jgi:hypothetical protein
MPQNQQQPNYTPYTLSMLENNHLSFTLTIMPKQLTTADGPE